VTLTVSENGFVHVPSPDHAEMANDDHCCSCAHVDHDHPCQCYARSRALSCQPCVKHEEGPAQRSVHHHSPDDIRPGEVRTACAPRRLGTSHRFPREPRGCRALLLQLHLSGCSCRAVRTASASPCASVSAQDQTFMSDAMTDACFNCRQPGFFDASLKKQCRVLAPGKSLTSTLPSDKHQLTSTPSKHTVQERTPRKSTCVYVVKHVQTRTVSQVRAARTVNT
jgi:hypothetical protein